MKLKMRFVGSANAVRRIYGKDRKLFLGVDCENSPAYRYTRWDEDVAAAMSIPEEVVLALNSNLLPYFEVDMEVSKKRVKELDQELSYR